MQPPVRIEKGKSMVFDAIILTISRVNKRPKNILNKQEVLFSMLSTHHYYILLLFLCLSFVFKGRGRFSSGGDDHEDDGLNNCTFCVEHAFIKTLSATYY